MAKSDARSREGSRRPFAVAGWRQIERRAHANHRDDRRWPTWLSILFILVSSLALWALIIWGVWWVIA